jgi:alkylation response protein AidB-like acyl-CoA dehydrogenase
MQPTFGAEAEAFRAEVRQFLTGRLGPDWNGLGALEVAEAERFTEEWRAELSAAGWLAVSWPKRYGGAGLTEVEQVVLAQELVRFRVPDGTPQDRFGIKMLGNTLIKWGTPEQKDRFLPRILAGEDRWCQGFSEPDAGSDLASLRCRAERSSQGWRINGQKIWTSLAERATWIFLLARTNPDAPKHRGISFLLCELGQPGVEIRPIEALGGQRDFCDVYFHDALVEPGCVVGEVDGGWAVANTLLGFERGEAAATFPLKFREELDRLIELARSSGQLERPGVRDRLARAFAEVEVMRFLGLRALTGILSGSGPGPEASVTKLYWSEYHRRVTELAVDILGPRAMTPSGRWPGNMIRTDDPGAPNDSASWVGTFLNARAGTIYAGTSEVQRNVLGEQVLGLPREPR